MMDWLIDDLESNTRFWTIAYFHHAPYSKGSHDSDTDETMIEMRQNWLPVLEEYGVDLVLSGHSHAYERSYLLNGHYGDSGELLDDDSPILSYGNGSPSGDGSYMKSAFQTEGAVYAVVGSSSKISGGSLDHLAMATSLNELGSMVIDVDGCSLEAAFIDTTGTVLDDFRIFKCFAPVGPVFP